MESNIYGVAITTKDQETGKLETYAVCVESSSEETVLGEALTMGWVPLEGKCIVDFAVDFMGETDLKEFVKDYNKRNETENL